MMGVELATLLAKEPRTPMRKGPIRQDSRVEAVFPDEKTTLATHQAAKIISVTKGNTMLMKSIISPLK